MSPIFDIAFIDSATGFVVYDFKKVQDPTLCDLVESRCKREAVIENITCIFLISLVVAAAATFFASIASGGLVACLTTKAVIKGAICTFGAVMATIIAIHAWRKANNFKEQAQSAAAHRTKLLQNISL